MLAQITATEYKILMEALRDKYGFGYSSDPAVAKLQAKLSILAEVAQAQEGESQK